MVAFDLDGTLVDSVPDLAWAGDEMLRRVGLPARGEASARQWVGNGIERFLKRMLSGRMDGEPEVDLFNRALPLYREIYTQNVCRLSSVYPGVFDGLEYLRTTDVKVCCITNKSGVFAEKLLKEIGLSPYFDLLVAGDTTSRRKPDPEPLLYAASQLGVDAVNCWMVGDSKNDVEAARAAGFSAVCVPYGYNHGEDISNTNPDVIIETLAQLSEIFALPA